MSNPKRRTRPWPRYLKEDYLESFSEAIADTGADGDGGDGGHATERGPLQPAGRDRGAGVTMEEDAVALGELRPEAETAAPEQAPSR